MKKFFSLFLLFTALSFSAFSQTVSVEEPSAKAAEEIKAALISKLNLSAGAADKIIVIENEFYKNLAEVNAQTELKLVDREVKLNKVHTTQRSKLLATPLTPREMEDVIDLIRIIRIKYKL